MATNTTKLALSKPDGTDLVDIAVLNGNFDKIDAASGATICTSSTRPASPFNGQLIFETDTLNALVYRTSTTSWNIVGGSTVSSNPPAGAGNGNFWWDSDNGILYIYYNDGNSSQWVSVMPSQTTVDVAQNVLMNGDFNVNQRGFSSSTSSGVFGADRWTFSYSTGTCTYSLQPFTPGAAPVAGYEGRNFARLVSSGQSAANAFMVFGQRIEDVRTLAGQTATISFWAKAASGTPQVSMEIDQYFGIGGSAELFTNVGKITLTGGTSWTRYTATVTIPSISGKTINSDPATTFVGLNLWLSAGSDQNTRSASLGIQNNTFDFWGMQIEKGSVATSFKRSNGGSIQSELEACQRYFYRHTGGGANATLALAQCYSSTQATAAVNFPVSMRIAPTASFSAASTFSLSTAAFGTVTCTVANAGAYSSFTAARCDFTIGSASLVTGNASHLMNNTGAAFIDFSAEL